jgi:hypothetical protein
MTNEKAYTQHRGGTDPCPVRREDGDNARIPHYPYGFHGTMRTPDLSRESGADLPQQNKNQIEKPPMKTIQQSTITHLQEIFFDVCDTLNGESAKDIGYESKTEMFEEFRWKLEAIEEDLRSVFGDLEANQQ